MDVHSTSSTCPEEGAPAGYKQTEVGVIPQDWEVRSLEGIADPKQPICYGIVQVGPFSNNGIPVLAIKNLNTDYRTNVHQCSPEIEAPYTRSRVHSGDILISVKGTTGRVGIVPPYFDGNISRDLARIRLSKDHLPKYWLQMLQSDTAQRVFDLATVGTTRLEISIGILKQIRLPFPSLDEQRAIAEALSDVDGLLGSLEKLIAKKWAIKQVAMQQLLTGQTRLPGFGGVWETTTLGETADIKNGATPNTQIASYWNGPIAWCTPTDITSATGKYLFATERSITTEGLTSCAASLLPVGALLLCSRATIGEVKIATSPVCTNQGFKSLVCKDGVSNEFLYYLILTLKPQMIERAIGSTFLEIGKRDLASVAVSLPPPDEQHAIAAVLSDMDTEIVALERRRDKTRAIKQGMMQQLLTGRVRLVKSPSTAEALKC